MLVIPWAGLQFVLELDTALRQQAATQLEQQAGRVASLIDVPAIDESRPGGKPVTYAPTLDRPLKELDGYGSGWPEYDEEHSSQPWQGTGTLPDNATLKWRVAVQENNLYL